MNLKFKKLAKSFLRTFFKSSNVNQIRSNFFLKLRKKFFTKKFSTKDFVFFLNDLGIEKGDTVIMQSSWTEFYNYTGRPIDIVSSVIDLIGSQGNIVMPAGSTFKNKTIPFDILKKPTNTGIICEVFRRTKGVKRSIHYNSIVNRLIFVKI